MTPPRCSVVIPCYNAAPYLGATLGSVLGQSHPVYEAIVVDDGSTDASAAIAQQAGSIVRVVRQRNQGESVARNAGLRLASGDYVLFLDADDLLARESIERLAVAATARPGAIAVMGSALFSDDPAHPFETHLPQFDAFFPGIIQTNFGPPHCWLTPRTLALQVGGFREDLQHSEDWEFWARLGLSGAPLIPVSYVGALYRRHAASQVATTPKPSILLGRLRVGEATATGLMKQPELLDRFGEPMFWSLWTLYRQARGAGVAAGDLEDAERLLGRLVSEGPAPLRRSTFAVMVRTIGLSAADRLRSAWLGTVGR
jgi:GT2 family glycosyltransferase